MIRNYARPLILVLAGAALAASAASLYVHYQMLMDPLYTSFCNISDSVNCEAVYASQYGAVFGVPVAAAGAIWAGLVLLLGWTGLQGRKSERTAVVLGYIFLLSLVSMAAVLWFSYASFVVLGVTCLLCLAFHASAVGIFIVSGASSPTPLGTLFARLGRDLGAVQRDGVGQTVALAWIAASIALVVLFPRAPITAAEGPTAAAGVAAAPALTEVLSEAQRTQLVQWVDTQTREDIPVPPEAEGAAVVIQKFNDYICPACRQTYVEYLPVVAKWRASHPDEVAFVYRDFPLEAECNVGSIHLSACEAAVAVRLAKEVDRHEELEAWLFDNQPTMTPDRVKEGLELVAGVPAETYDARYDEVLEAVREDARLGIQLNVESTPTFFVNGIRIVGGLRPAYLDALIADELERAGVSPGPAAD